MKLKIVDQISAKFTNLDEKNRYYIFTGILVFVFLIDYFIIMHPQLGTLSKLALDNKSLSEEIDDSKSEIQKLGLYKKQIERAEEKLKATSGKIRPREAVPLVLENISRIANKNGIKIEQMVPQSGDQKILTSTKERKYYSLPIVVDAKGGYHNFGRFLNQMENEGLYLAVTSFSLTSGGESKTHSIKFTLKAIVFEE